MSKIEVTKNNVLINPTTVKEQRSGGIIIPTTSDDAISFGEVVAVGEDVSYTIGNTVFYRKGRGTSFTFEGEDYTVLSFDDVLGRINQ
jgi:co-chaperonin GroES (HSP10)